MRLFGQSFGPDGGPFMASDRRLVNPRPDLLAGSRYQIVPGPSGLPMAQVTLNFRRDAPCVSNPAMTLAVLLDRSGSMREAFAEGHVHNVATAIFDHVAAAGVGYDLLFYDDGVADAGHMHSRREVQTVVQRYGPGGGTHVTPAMRAALQKRQAGRGLYLIVITDGEFADKDQARRLVLQEMLPQVTPEDPYAFRLHFIGAGEGADHAFLRQIEADAAGQGIPLVTHHHHAHLSHSHASILDELDRAFLGVGTDAQFGTLEGMAGTAITHTTDPATRRAWPGGVGALGFLPRRALLGCEYAPAHPDTLEVGVRFQGRGGAHQFSLPVPLPQRIVVPPATTLPPARKLGFHLPWLHRSPEEEAARADMESRRVALVQRAAADREAEAARQAHDMRALAQGGLPAQATLRLKELGAEGTGAGALFTSDLTPEEAGLLRREGYRVRGLVTGSAMYHVGQAYASTQGDCEVDVLSKAYDAATELAVTRMRQELALIGAHGVVGVRLSLIRHEWADKTVEVQVLGTAVEGPGAAPADPWLSDLSGQEWWALHRAGYEPAALVWGHCTWFILTTQSDEWILNSWQNQELTHWSQALGRARHRAMAHLTAQATRHRATGVAGVRVERRMDEVRLTGPGEDPAYEREHHNLAVSILGTAIRLRPDAPAGVRPTVQVLSLRDGRLCPAGMGAADVTVE